MREIKFRAWNNENKQMIYNAAVRNSHYLYAIQTSGNDAWDIRYIEDDGFEVMQFTGLTDKNGKDIYESDILSVVLNEKCILPGNVFYTGGCFKWMPNHKCYSEYLFFIKHESKIIGNMHQNPELLKWD